MDSLTQIKTVMEVMIEHMMHPIFHAFSVDWLGMACLMELEQDCKLLQSLAEQ